MKTYYMQGPEGSFFTTIDPKYHPDSAQVSIAKGKAGIEAQSKCKLKELLKKHPTIYTVIRSVSSSGMSRTMDFWIVQQDGLRRITPLMIDVLGWGESPKGHLKVMGCGMDMSWHACYVAYQVLDLDVKKMKNDIL